MKTSFSFLRNGLHLCIVCIGFAFIGCDFTPYEDYYNQAIDAQRKGDFKEALYYINKSIKQNPNITDSYFLRAECFIEFDDWETALLDYQKIVKLDPQNTMALYALATSNGRIEKYEKAISYFNEAYNSLGAIETGTKIGASLYLANDFNHYNGKDQMFKVEIQFTRGQTYLMNHQYDSAIADFTQLIALEHFEKFSHYNLGNAYLGKKDSINACSHFIESAKLGYDKAKEKLKDHCI